MATYNRMTRQDAEAAGFTVDQSCYPWFGYTGPRFNPTQRVEVYTDLESEMMRKQKAEEEADYDDLLLAELKSDAQRIGASLATEDTAEAGMAYQRLASKVRNAVDKSLLLHGYLCHAKEYDLNSASLDEGPNPRVTIVYHRSFGKSGGTRFFAEARIVVTTDTVEFLTRVCQEKRTIAYDLKSSSQVVCGHDSDTILSFVRAGLTVSLGQVAHVAGRESIPTVFGLPV